MEARRRLSLSHLIQSTVSEPSMTLEFGFRASDPSTGSGSGSGCSDDARRYTYRASVAHYCRTVGPGDGGLQGVFVSTTRSNRSHASSLDHFLFGTEEDFNEVIEENLLHTSDRDGKVAARFAKGHRGRHEACLAWELLHESPRGNFFGHKATKAIQHIWHGRIRARRPTYSWITQQRAVHETDLQHGSLGVNELTLPPAGCRVANHGHRFQNARSCYEFTNCVAGALASASSWSTAMVFPKCLAGRWHSVYKPTTSRDADVLRPRFHSLCSSASYINRTLRFLSISRDPSLLEAISTAYLRSFTMCFGSTGSRWISIVNPRYEVE